MTDRSSRTRQRGSAFIISLLVIVVITFLGLTLSMVTSTEMQLGGNDRELQRAFYACNSGLAISAARLIVRQDSLVLTRQGPNPGDIPTEQPVQINESAGTTDPTADGSPSRGTRVLMSPGVKLNQGPAALSQVNRSDNQPILMRGVMGYRARGYRYDTGESPSITTPDRPLGARFCSTILDMQPFKIPLAVDFTSANAGATVGSKVVDIGSVRFKP